MVLPGSVARRWDARRWKGTEGCLLGGLVSAPLANTPGPEGWAAERGQEQDQDQIAVVGSFGLLKTVSPAETWSAEALIQRHSYVLVCHLAAGIVAAACRLGAAAAEACNRRGTLVGNVPVCRPGQQRRRRRAAVDMMKLRGPVPVCRHKAECRPYRHSS